MTPYILLLFSVLAEIIATSSLKASQGFTKPIPSIMVVVGYVIAFWLLSVILKTLPVSVVYAVWCGLGIFGVAIIGVFYFNEVFGLWHLLGTALVIAGIVILTTVSAAH